MVIVSHAPADASSVEGMIGEAIVDWLIEWRSGLHRAGDLVCWVYLVSIVRGTR